MSLAVVLASLGQLAPAPPSRTERVLALFDELVRTIPDKSCFADTIFLRAPSRLAKDTSYPFAWCPIWCGLAYTRPIDVARARDLAARTFAIFDLDARPLRFECSDGSADLDLADLKAKIAFDLDLSWNVYADVEEEPPSVVFEADEYAALAAAGWRTHAVELKHFPGINGDEFTSTWAFLAGVVEFLDGATQGEDVDVSGLLFASQRQVPPFGPWGVEREFSPFRPHWNVEGERGALWWTIQPSVSCESALVWPQFEQVLERFPPLANDQRPPVSSRGSATVLAWSARGTQGYGGSCDPIERVILRQRAGASTLTLESTSPIVIVPPRFDLQQPFDVELDVAPGFVSADHYLRIGLPVRKR